MIYFEISELLKYKRTLHSDTLEKESGTHGDIRGQKMGMKVEENVQIITQMDSVNVNLSQGSPNSVRILNSTLEEKV